MIKYSELVQYIKDNHVNWNTDLFDVLKGFFNQYSPPTPPNFPYNSNSHFNNPSNTSKFKEPDNGEYTIDDLFNLFT